MAERANPETLQPSLLDRLTDNSPNVKTESAERSSMNMRALRQAVMRDLGWLLNTGNLGTVVDLEDLEEVQNSVLNYGMPDLAGLTVTSMDMRMLQRLLHKTIVRFEPRIDSNTLNVRLNVKDDRMSRHALTLDIEGDLWAHPSPTRLFLKTELDLETGDVAVRDASGRS